ncbi:MAG: hypothetical protein PHW76_07270 [Alphaproteobacteria bacterium]|nr:hypothetical protein [Alphaproteobacteria bacterium]
MKTTQEYLAYIKEIEETAFQRGYQAAVQKILQAVEQPTVSLSAKCPTAVKVKKSPFKNGTDSAAVFNFIKGNSGLRGTEIIRKSGIPAKTVRTALYRMKVKGFAANERGKWFVR